ncbi:conjugal transfer protein TrbL family protein [Maledivibacter halophilus]|uniref:conjugal transfer protein TrbL family protein n=1 Tax=Maledivibacter halophilus TaxID=36842 RepID=UPI0009A839DC|nr:conjugal transfer protein TrbL family protein [Maledivibacter halophilus]
MEVLLVLLIVAILNGCLTYANSVLEGLSPIALYAETYMGTLLKTNGFTKVFDIFFSFGISLIVLKFLKKGFDIYILWTDGDAEIDPLILLTGFFKALAIAVSFPTLYGWMATIIEDMTNKILTAIGLGMNEDFTSIISGISTAGLFTAIVSLIFFICFFLLYIQFLIRGMEIFILRVGLPLACSGLIDSDGGVFRTYIQKFFQSTLAVLIQIVLAKLGVGLMLNLHVFWGIAALMLAIKTPRFLQEFIIVSGGTGNPMGTAYSGIRLVQIAKRAFKK